MLNFRFGKRGKKSSDEFIRKNKFSTFQFKWQGGFGVFSYSQSQLTDVIQYIGKQKDHHKKQTFKEEFLTFLDAFEIEFSKEYLFDWIPD